MHTSASDLHPREVRSPVDTGIGIVRRAFGVRYAKFNDALLTGHPEVDAQHRALYSLVNDLNAQTVIGKGSREDVEVALERILRYAAEHFAA